MPAIMRAMFRRRHLSTVLIYAATRTSEAKHTQNFQSKVSRHAGAEQIEAVENLNLRYGESNWTEWYSSREFRDRRTVFFVDRFDSDATFQYAMRVQIPGEFIVAPARAELMYRPATHANTSSQQFVFMERH